jgi:glycosyltransferase involved in cell wall biosynthesis
MNTTIEVSYVLPCLNEEKTLLLCINECKNTLEKHGIAGEIIVADNSSTDASLAIAEQAGVEIVRVPEKGYGRTLVAGIARARGTYIFIADSDMSYDFSLMTDFLAVMKDSGCDLVIGCRLPWKKGRIEKGAMPFLNKYFGNPFLSSIGRLLFGVPVSDFNCGARMILKSSFKNITFKQPGMEFASEMLVKAHVSGLRIKEIPITLRNDLRGKPSHLRPFRDGFRNLFFMLSYRFSRSE